MSSVVQDKAAQERSKYITDNEEWKALWSQIQKHRFGVKNRPIVLDIEDDFEYFSPKWGYWMYVLRTYGYDTQIYKTSQNKKIVEIRARGL